MAFRPLLRQRAVGPATPVLLAAALSLYPIRSVHAEAPEADHLTSQTVDGVSSSIDLSLTAAQDLRKPIYEDITSPPFETAPSPPVKTAPKPSSPTPTDRLTTQVARARLFLHGYAAKSEDQVNNLLTEALRLENSFTSTIASLGPAKESGEKVMPGAIYVLVSAMAGSIVTRNRNILLRTTLPVAVGIAASYAILPITTRNVGNLIWTYEERYPVVADNHIRIKERVSRFVETGKAHSQTTVAMLEDKIGGVREAVEDWVRKGK